MILKIFLLVGLIRLLIAIEKPLVCAGIYAGVCTILALIGTLNILAALLVAVLSFGVSWLYFWLLDRFDTLSVGWFVTLFIGLGIVLRLS